MPQRSKGGSSGTLAGELRPVWPERNPLLVSPNGFRLPVVSERAALDRETDAYRARIASGKVAWPPPRLVFMGGPAELTSGDLRDVLPREFDWRHPQAFLRLDAVRRLRLTELAALAAEGYPSQVAEERASLAMNQLYMQAMWMHHGRRVYRLDPGLTELLLQTRLPQLPASTLRFPLHAFLIALPEGRFTAGLESDPDPQPVDSIMIAVDQVNGDTDEYRELTLLLTCRSPQGPLDDNVVCHGFAMGAHARLDEIQTTVISGPVRELVNNALRLAVGLVLYLQSEHPALEPVPPPARVNLDAIRNPGKRRKAEQRLSRASKLGFFWVGRNEGAGVANLEQVARSANGSWSLDHQVWVSGHWREQPYGPRNSLRRPQWIKPYLKGPDMADTMRINAQRIQAAQAAGKTSGKGTD